MKILQCQDYVNINDLTSRVPLSLKHYINDDQHEIYFENNQYYDNESYDETL